MKNGTIVEFDETLGGVVISHHTGRVIGTADNGVLIRIRDFQLGHIHLIPNWLVKEKK